MSTGERLADAPTRRQLRIQAALDSGAALVLAMLAWPFPLARAVLPLPVNIVSVIVFWQLVQVLYCALTVGFLEQTGGMRLQGLRLAGDDGAPATRGARLRWGALCGALALVHAVAPADGQSPTLAERIAGVRIRAL